MTHIRKPGVRERRGLSLISSEMLAFADGKAVEDADGRKASQAVRAAMDYTTRAIAVATGDMPAADRYADVLQVTRLSNPAGWAVQLETATRGPGPVRRYVGSLTMEQAIERARRAARSRA